MTTECRHGAITGVSVMIKLQLLSCLYNEIMIMITQFFKNTVEVR